MITTHTRLGCAPGRDADKAVTHRSHASRRLSAPSRRSDRRPGRDGMDDAARSPPPWSGGDGSSSSAGRKALASQPSCARCCRPRRRAPGSTPRTSGRPILAPWTTRSSTCFTGMWPDWWRTSVPDCPIFGDLVDHVAPLLRGLLRPGDSPAVAHLPADQEIYQKYRRGPGQQLAAQEAAGYDVDVARGPTPPAWTSPEPCSGSKAPSRRSTQTSDFRRTRCSAGLRASTGCGCCRRWAADLAGACSPAIPFGSPVAQEGGEPLRGLPSPRSSS